MDKLQPIVQPLLAWYGQHQRKLPWRNSGNAYYIWLSEVMLQQTRMAAAVPFFLRFIKALPTLEALAAAPQEQVQKLWEGLGYYTRAKNLQMAAKLCLEQYGGLPADYQALRKLPGFGPYTAGAVASMAFSLAYPAVDGNVLRILARYCNSRSPVDEPAAKKAAEALLAAVLPDNPGDFNQALMELGALVCVPAKPDCVSCPLQIQCAGFAAGEQNSLPVYKKTASMRVASRKREKWTVLRFVHNGFVALERRPEKGLLAGMWGLPMLEGHLRQKEVKDKIRAWGLEALHIKPLPPHKHVFTHREWEMIAYSVTVAAPTPNFVWQGFTAPLEKAVPSAFKSFLQDY